ncbi:MAG: hypothetical protein ACK57O_19890, partial [Planctomyces sp.]
MKWGIRVEVVSGGRLSLALREALAGRRGFSHGLSRIMAVVFSHGWAQMNRSRRWRSLLSTFSG